MRTLMTTQNQNCYREQIQKEMLTRLTWKSRYARDYLSCYTAHNKSPRDPAQPPRDPAQPPRDPAQPPRDPAQPPRDPAQPPRLSCLLLPSVPPLMRAVSPQTRRTLYQSSSHHGKGRSLYLERRGQKRPEEKFDYPLLSSWEYGWRLGDYRLDYRSPASGRSAVVKSNFYSRNGVFNIPSATDTLG
ncbi:uncharacterized protein ACJ7VT_011034 [Polymixia lowei]